MAFPAGVTTCRVEAVLSDITGRARPGHLHVECERTITHAASRRIFERFAGPFWTASGVLSVELPHTDQSGFVDENGAPITNWAYHVTFQQLRDTARVSQGFVRLPSSLGASVGLHQLVDLGGWPNQTVVLTPPTPAPAGPVLTAVPGLPGFYTYQ